MEGKTIFLTLASVGVLTTLFAFKKKNDFSKVMEEMTLDVRNIRNLKLIGSKLVADIDLGIHNPTKYDMTVYTAGLITLKKIELFYKGVLLGTANSLKGKDTLELPANSNYLVTDITMEIAVLNVVDQFYNHGLDSNMANYTAKIYADAIGKSWVIEQ